MALTVIFGLTSSTVLTLIVIPSIYYGVIKLRMESSRASEPDVAPVESIPAK
jgi:Cu/Ag efflux pump CusA